jgi:hypothetical protein
MCGFGMPRGEISIEADDIAYTHANIESFQKYEELPLVSTGCDSYASWHPAFKDLSPMLERCYCKSHHGNSSA